jgi:hypothetical protein
VNDVYTWQNDLYPLVTKRFNDRLAKRVDVMKLVIGEEDTDRVDIREEGMGGFGEVPDYNGTDIPELSQKRGFVKIYTPKEKAAKASIGFKKAKIDQSGEAKKTGERMADSLAMTRLMDFYRMFANGYGGGIVGADGQQLFSTAHPINSDAGADVYSNLITDAYSISAITKAQSAARRFVTYDGLPFLSQYDLCLISPELEPKAKEFFGAEAKLIPESNENGANPVHGMKYFVIDGFTAKQWAVGDSQLIKDFMKIVNITKPMVIYNKEASNPLIAYYTAYMDYTMGWSECRQIIGSNPP